MTRIDWPKVLAWALMLALCLAFWGMVARAVAAPFELRPGERLDAPTYLAPAHPVAYQWLRCDARGRRCQDIAAHRRIYTMQASDVRHTIRVRMYYARRPPITSGPSAIVFPQHVQPDAASWS